METLDSAAGQNRLIRQLGLSSHRISSHVRQLHVFMGKYRDSLFKEKGIALIETIVAVALLGTVAITVLSGLGTSTKASEINEKRVIAESLVRSEIEYVKETAYQYSISEYPVDPTLSVPEGWVIPSPQVQPLHETDDGIQRVVVTARYRDEPVLSVIVYKVDR